MKSIVILASGQGSNARKIIETFDGSDTIQVSAIISDRKASGAMELAKEKRIKGYHIPQKAVQEGKLLLILEQLKPDLVILAGFLRKIPIEVVKLFPNSIVNIHPSLLPKHGGKGKYGQYVHQSVIEAGDVQSGITIHYVNEEYDKGQFIAQFYCPVKPSETVESLTEKVHRLELHYFPLVIHTILHP